MKDEALAQEIVSRINGLLDGGYRKDLEPYFRGLFSALPVLNAIITRNNSDDSIQIVRGSRGDNPRSIDRFEVVPKPGENIQRPAGGKEYPG